MTTIAPSALEQAEAAFRRGDFAAARDLLAGATGARALTVLGAAEHALHDDVAAEAHSRAALEAWGRDAGGEPPAALHNNLGLAIAGQGRIAEAIPSLLAAVNAEPNSRDFRANLALHLLALGSQAHHDAVRVALGAPGAPEGVIAAIVAYERGDLAACRRVLDLVRPGFEARAAGGMDARQWHNLDVYRRYLGALLRERERNPSRYAEPGVLPALTFVGDSHSLIPAGLRVRFLGQEWRGVPHLVMGAKAWHVSRGVDNRYGAAFRIALGRLSEGATAVAMFGEIDCRADEGILPRALAHPEEPLDASVEALVRGYVATALEEATRRGVTLHFATVPAPNPAAAAPHGIDPGRVAEVVSLFNVALRLAAAGAGTAVLDLHERTAGAGGVARAGVHLDTHHLRPEMFR